MENQGNVICRADFKRSITPLSCVVTVLWLIILALGYYVAKIALFGTKEQYDYVWLYVLEQKIIPIVLVIIPFVILLIEKIIAKRCKLELTEGHIKGELKTTFGKKNLQMPIDHLDSVMTSNGFTDKIRGGETLLISSNSGLIKFHYVQNADEFAQAAMKLIDEAKKKVPSAPQTAPVQNVTGGDAMEKINSLKQMLDSGLITQEDFEQKKADILSKM